jgi:hypothetical protein
MNDIEMKQIWIRFNANISALWMFADRISQVADAEDHEQISQLAQKVAFLFDESPGEVEKELVQFVKVADEAEVEPNMQDQAQFQDVTDAFQSGDFKNSAQKWLRRYPKKNRQFVGLIRSIFEPVAANGILLRRSSFVLLVSFFESLIVDLLTMYFTSNPNIKVNEHIINRGSFPDRLKLLGTTGADLVPFELLKQNTLEIIRRRNLLTHHDAIIDLDFINHTTRINPKFAPGRRLRISQTYLIQSIESTLQYSYLIFQKCWRAWVRGNHEEADKHFNDMLVSLLSHNHNEIVVQLTNWGKEFQLSRLNWQILVVNHAIALRDLGLKSEMHKLIDSEIRKPIPMQVRFAVHILKEEYDSALILFSQLAKNGKLRQLSAELPLFKPILSDQRFIPYLDRIR